MLKLPKGEITIRNADRRYGYFFCVNWDHPSPDTYLDEGTHAKCVFDRKRRLEVGVIGYETPPQLYDPRCLAYPDIPHFMSQQLDNVVVQWRSSDPDDFDAPSNMLRDGLIYCDETAYHFIGRPLLETFQQKGLSGLVVSKVAQERSCEDAAEWLADDDLVMIDGAHSPIAPMTILPEEANRCEHCGYGPLLCPGCGKIKLDDWDSSCLCPKCGKIWRFGSDATESQMPEMRIQHADPFPSSFVDMTRWDGSDFNKGMLVTRRVVDLLERLKCGSFRAEPVAVDVAGLTDEQWKLLEASRGRC